MRNLPQASASGLLSYFTRHRTAASLLLLVLLLSGLVSLPNLRAQFFPDIVRRAVSVDVYWNGAGAEEVDSAIIELMTPSLMAIEGVETVTSSARAGRAYLYVVFEPDWSLERGASDIRVVVDATTDLPEAAEDPEIRVSVWRERVTDVLISGPVDPYQLGLYGDELIALLYSRGVTRSTLHGVAAPQTVVEVPSVNLVAHDLSMAEIAAAIAAEADTDPAGDVAGTNTRVSTGSEKRAADQIADIVLRTSEDGSQLTLGDVAILKRPGPDRDLSLFVGATPAVSIRVDRSAQGDAIDIQNTVEETVADLQRTLPEGVKAELVNTRSDAISSRLSMLIENGLTGLALVVGLLFLFLNARTAFWVAAGIPVAMLAALSIMYLGGQTLNMITLFGLIITLGIVVDDAIVVGEHADYRARHLGEAPVVAAENAARRMAMPVLAATLTTIIAFSGLAMIDGWYGRFVRDIPLTVVAVVAASLIECFLILPNHMSHALAARARERWYDWPSRQVNRGFVWFRERLFRPFMAGVITCRYAVLAGALLLLASQVALFIRGDVQWRFFNAPERGVLYGNFAMAEGATREDSLVMMRQLQRAVDEVSAEYEAEYGVAPITSAVARVGGNAGRGLSGSSGKDGDLLGGIAIEMTDADLRPFTSGAFVTDLQERVVQHPLAEVVSFRRTRSGPEADAIDIELFGADASALKAASLDIQAALASFPEVSALEDTLAYDREELILDLTARGTALGFTSDTLGRTLRNRIGGIEAATYPEGRRSAEIRVELPEEELTADFLESTQLRTPDGLYVPLTDIVTVQQRAGFGEIKRYNGVRVISVKGDVSEDNPERANEIQDILANEILPAVSGEHQVRYRIAGLAEQESAFLSGAMNGQILCLAGIYLVLAWIFGSWSRPAVVMVIIPFGLIGAIYGHVVWDVPLSMFTVVGLLGMSGIIINDSIVLVTTIDEYAGERGLIPSIIDGTADRLRPVLLTTLTTVLGMAPLLYEKSVQAQFLKPAIVTLVYGLGFGMVLVLLIVPALLAVGHDLSRHVQAMRRGLRLPVRSVRVSFTGLWVLIVAWAAVTMGWAAWQGSLPGALVTAAPWAAALPPVSGALMLFSLGCAMITLLAWLSAVLWFVSRRRRAQPGVHP
ncbi:efflux RND transporter permease subunit [uncultured Roseobacter sp.]|uniref:efflux RND transporter permease subunit n=1 Tax=uncultured Roseobacter sp. TaxID=114847 RepID=UPI0026398D70|nr:efflux RND transporter permease subunit [uncultured Roseobacter sp.]